MIRRTPCLLLLVSVLLGVALHAAPGRAPSDEVPLFNEAEGKAVLVRAQPSGDVEVTVADGERAPRVLRFRAEPSRLSALKSAVAAAGFDVLPSVLPPGLGRASTIGK